MPAADDPQTCLDALRARGAHDRDPVRFALIEALARRAAGQPILLRPPLVARIKFLADELDAHATPKSVVSTQPAAPSPLADLLTYIGEHTHGHTDLVRVTGGVSTVNRNFRPKSTSAITHRAHNPELKAVAYFRNEWSKLSTEQQLTQTLAQAPENAGPMNSQHLVLRSLQLMRDIAPDYLQGFMTYVDSLIWLEQADPTRMISSRTAGNTGKKSAAARRKPEKP